MRPSLVSQRFFLLLCVPLFLLKSGIFITIRELSMVKLEHGLILFLLCDANKKWKKCNY